MMATSQSFHWESDPESTFVPGLQGYIGQLETMLHEVAQEYAPQIEAWMKQNAQWTDRTGNARQALYADVQEFAAGAAIILDHGMEYGVYLELANQGVWGIIAPALDEWGPKVWAEVKRRMG